jgi:hypothetical protein
VVAGLYVSLWYLGEVKVHSKVLVLTAKIRIDIQTHPAAICMALFVLNSKHEKVSGPRFPYYISLYIVLSNRHACSIPAVSFHSTIQDSIDG